MASDDSRLGGWADERGVYSIPRGLVGSGCFGHGDFDYLGGFVLLLLKKLGRGKCLVFFDRGKVAHLWNDCMDPNAVLGLE